MSKKNIVAISGSNRKNSTNHSFIKAIEELSGDVFNITLFEGIADLPHFNPDIKEENFSKKVLDFKQLLQLADGIIICTPEYAHGVPGTLKNAIDWTVSSCEFSQKPTFLITASTEGNFGHQALLETLKVIEAKGIDELQLVISFAKTKLNQDGVITDLETLNKVKTLLKKLNEVIELKS